MGINTMTIDNLGKESYSSAYSQPGTLHYQGKSGQDLKQDRNLEARADAKATEECCSLT